MRADRRIQEGKQATAGRRGLPPQEALSVRRPPFPFSTISDLAYCKEVEAVVTASRDSTVKVWEADWQVRMVFVGHTGAPFHLGPFSLHPV